MESNHESELNRLTIARRRWVMAGFMLVLLGLFLLAVAILFYPDDHLVLYDASFYGTLLIAALLCGARARWVETERAAWTLMTLVLVSDLTANVVYEALGEPFPSVADVLWVASYAFLIASLLSLGRRRLGRSGRVVWLDGLIAVLTLSALAAAFVLPPIVEALPDEGLASIATLVYPLADIIVLATAFVIFAVSRWQASLGWWAIMGAVLLWAVGDAWFGYLDAVGRYYPIVDLTWPAAALLLALAAWSPSPPPLKDPAVHWRAGSLASICGLLALGLLILDHYDPLNSASFYLSVLAIGGLGLRLVLAHRENDRLLKLAQTDPLTGIHSRGRLVSDAAQLEAAGRPVTIVLFDLDGFKLYNDSFGHAAGDALLIRIARRLANAVAGFGDVYRIGGDEFTALFWGDMDETAAVVAAADFAMCERGDGFDIQASRGVALYPAQAPTIDSAIALADERMYLAKSTAGTSARNQVHEALVRSLREREPDLADHTDDVRELVVNVARKFFDHPGDVDVRRTCRTTSRCREGRDTRCNPPRARPPRRRRTRPDATAHPDRRADRQRVPGACPDRDPGPEFPRTLGRNRLPGWAGRGPDPARLADHPRVRRFRHHDQRPSVPQAEDRIRSDHGTEALRRQAVRSPCRGRPHRSAR